MGTIAAAAQRRKRVLVLGCYVSMGPAGMHQRYIHTAAKSNIPMPRPLRGKDIVLAKQGLLPDPAVADWIVRTAKHALR